MFLREQKLASSSVHGCTLLDRLFSKALEAAHLRIFLMAHFSLGSAIAALYLNGREPMRLWQAAHRLVRRIQEHPAANLA